MKLEIQVKGNKIFAPLKDTWLIATPEEKVRQKYIAHLVNHYGYNITQMAQEIKVSNTKRGTGKARADIVIWKSEKDKREDKNAFIVIECKADNIKIMEEDYFQGQNYAAYAGATFFITTNEKETKFFRVKEGYLPKGLEEIIDIPKAGQADNEREINKLLAQTKTFSRDEFSKLLFKCHCIIRNNDKLSPEAAFDEISKILFMKIRYERKPDEDIIFSLEKFQKDEQNYEKNIRPYLKGEEKNLPYIQILFRQTKDEFKDDKLFEESEIIRIKQASFEQIVKELEKYNLSATSDDVKGIAFEQFLGTTFRGELGQFFTPRTIVDFMVEVLNPQEGETICDPACGSGGFLIKAFEYVRENIEKDIHRTKEKIKANYFDNGFKNLSEKEQEKITEKVNNINAKLNEDLNLSNKDGRLYKLSSNCIYGTDANPRMARTSKMNMIMHGDGHGGVHHHDGLLNINGIFDERFDVVITNPPFGSRVDKTLKITEADIFTDAKKIQQYKEKYGDKYQEAQKQVNDNLGKPIINLYDTGEFSGLTEVLFMERCLKLLKKGGRMGIVLPEGVLNNNNLQRVRNYFESRAKIILICSIPQDVFIASGATVKPSLVFFKRFTEQEEKEYIRIKETAEKEIDAKYNVEIKALQDKYAKFRTNNKQNKTKLTEIRKEEKSALKDLEGKKEIDIRTEIKAKLNYQIPVVEVEKAGITTTGAQCDNELTGVAKSFAEFREKEKVFGYNQDTINYKIENDNLVKASN